MQNISFHELINRNELQRLQDEFCQVTDVCVYCLDENRKQLTKISTSEEKAKWMQQCINSQQIRVALERVEEGSLEDQAVEELGDGSGGAAAIAVRIDDNTVLYWVAFSKYSNENKENTRFFQALDLLRDASYALFHNKLSCFSAEAESRRSRYAEQEMSKTLHTIEATTEIVQLLDSDEQIELIMEKWLHILSEHLQVDTAQIFQVNTENDYMDVICEWRNRGVVSYFDRTSKLPIFNMLLADKPVVLSFDGRKNEYSQEKESVGLKAVIVFPIISQNGGGRMILSLNHRQQEHIWSMPEVKFTSDAVKVLQSILTRRIQKNSLVGSYEALEAILDNVGCAIYVTDKNTGSTLFANRRLQKTFAKELQDKTFDGLIEQGISEGQVRGAYEIQHSEKERWYDLIFKEISWVDGRRATLYSLYDITDKKLYQRKIEQQAHTDFLTGLYNRMCCERDLARQIDEAKMKGQTGALLYLDLDDFKHINDGLGHQYGDVLLKSISHSLQRIEGIRNTCYRMGGDEFVIVIPPSSYARFEKILEDIRQIFNKPWYLKDADYYCTMSMGVVTYPESGDSVADLIKKADIAMYEAKKSGKNRLAKYSESLDSASGRRLDMEKNMRDATAEGYKEFEIYYQPIIDIQNGQTRCAGAEALIRWNSEKLGFISPAEFIPLAEYLGLINPIGNYVLQEACRHCKEWNDMGYPEYKVNVNLSVVQLLQNDIVESVERTIQETGITPGNLTLEVTESLAINDMERMKEILNRIKALGVRIALDDFGTGYSSLNHIREIPFDVIKVDQSFVVDLAEDAYSRSFIKMVAELAETIGVSVCVEGIETEEQYLALKDMKVKYIQGFYFDRPMKRSRFEQKYLLQCDEKECKIIS